MREPKILDKIFRNSLGYVVAVGAVALATWLKLLAQPNIIPTNVPILYLVAIVPVAIFFGLGPSLLVCVLSFLAYDYYFIPPIHQITYSSDAGPILAIFLVVGVLFSYLTSNLRRQNQVAIKEIAARKKSEAELIKYRDHLEELVQQRTSELEKANLQLRDEISEHKKDEEALRQSEERWATTLSSIGDGVIATDISGRVSFMNTVAQDLTGWKTGEANQKPIVEIFNIINETTRQKAENPVDKVLQLSIICSLTNHTILIRKDGTEISIDDSGAPIKDAKGIISGVVLVFRDITERRKAEIILRHVEERNRLLADILEHASQPFGIGLPDGSLGIVNKAFCDLTGYTAEELKTLDWATVLTPPEYRSMETEKLAELARTGEPVLYEKEYIRKDKSRVPIELLVHLVRNAEGQVEYYYSFLTDITERKKAVEALRESEAKANALIKYAPTGIYEIDYRTQRFLSLNDAMSSLTGYTREELFALGPSELLDEESKKLFMTRIQHQLAGEKIDDSVEYRVKKKDGSTLWITLNIAFSKESSNIALVIGHDITERIETEKRLKESEEKFAEIFHSSPIGMVITHLPEGRCVEVNDAYLRMLEFSREEVIGRDSRDLNMHVDQNKRVEVFRLLREKGKVTNIELSFRTKTGRVIEVLSSIDRIKLQGQEYSLSTNIDITRRKQAEEEIHRLNRELRAIGECDQAIVHAADEQNLLNEICRILKETAGYRMAWVGTVEHDENKSVLPVVCSGDEEYLKKANITWADTERGRGPTGLAVRTGKTHYFQDFVTEPAAAPWREAALSMGYRSSIAIPLFDNTGTVFGVFTAYSVIPNYFNETEIKLLETLAGDISFGVTALRDRIKRKQAEAEISHLASFPEHNPMPIVEVSSEGDVIYANPSARLRFPLMIHGQKRKFLIDFINIVRDSETSVAVKDVYIDENWYEETMAYVASTNTYRLYAREITLRKKFEDELKQRTVDLEASNKELEAFSYSVSHDLRAPLRSITGFSTILLEDYQSELDKEGKTYLKKISDSGELMGQLMDDLLKLSRVTRSDLNIEKLDLSDMARNIVDELRNDEPKRKVKVIIAPNMTANGDKNLLGLVLQNLLGNAWKYSSKTSEPRIEMGTVEHNGKQAYFVHDNGVGFDMTYADKLFKPFQRLHKATEFTGTGIGLATVQRIIRRHGGEVWAESKVGEGATFYFTLN
jgi:PAS domain S-box-containing protein